MIEFVTFSGSLHWPSAGNDLGPGGVFHVELLILCELWAGERLQFEKAVPRCRRVDRPISVSAVPAGPSIDIWRSCRFLGALLRALGGLPGGLGRFLPCRVGAYHCRLRSIVWERCGHCLTSRPLEASDAGFLDDLLSLFGYPSGSGRSLVDGFLFGCGIALLILLIRSLLGGCRTLAVLVAAFSAQPLVAGLLVLGKFPAFELLEKLKRRGYDLPKRQMYVNVPGLIFGSSQFLNDVGIVRSGVGSSHLGEPMGIG